MLVFINSGSIIGNVVWTSARHFDLTNNFKAAKKFLSYFSDLQIAL